MDSALQAKWDRASQTYDFVTWADEYRYGAAKHRLFAEMRGRCLMLATGTGNDFPHFPPGLTITTIDISPAMVERAQRKAITMSLSSVSVIGNALRLRRAALE